MIVVSDNSALSALAEIGRLPLLPLLFGEVTIPEAVLRECLDPGAPEESRTWAGDPPDWLAVVSDPDPLLPETDGLGAGEASAITLAWRHRSDSRLILDERRGRRIAEALGLPKTGVLGILGHAAAHRLLDFDASVKALRATGFHLSDELVEAVRRRLP